MPNPTQSPKRIKGAAHRAQIDGVIDQLVNLHQLTHRLGLHRTGHKLHAAVQEVGYELADMMTADSKGQAGPHGHPGNAQ